MSRLLYQRILSGTALCAVLAGAVALPFGAWAQQGGERGGMWSQLRLTERFLSRTTSSPDPTEDGTTLQAVSEVDYSFSTETRTETFTLDFGAGYRFADGPNTDGITGDFIAPSLQLRYAQVAASASFQTTFTATQVDLADVSPLSVSDSSGAVLPTDVSELTDGGMRTQLGLTSRLTLRDDAPFGLAFGLRLNDISYSDLPPGSGLNDSLSTRGDVTGRFDITPVLQASLGAHYTLFQTDGEGESSRYGLTTGARLAQPNGAYALNAGLTNGDGGLISTLSLGRSYELPQTKTNLALGLAQATDDSVFVTGSAALEHTFGGDSAFGPLTLSADRDVSLTTSEEEVLTSLAMGGSYALSPQAGLRLSAELGQAEEVATGDSVTLSEAVLALDYTFTRTWRGTANLKATSRDPSDSAATTSTSLGLSITRSFETRH